MLSSGEQVFVSNTSYPDLFFGLKVPDKSCVDLLSVLTLLSSKGGLNNFGIVTNITFEAHPQTLVYVGEVPLTHAR